MLFLFAFYSSFWLLFAGFDFKSLIFGFPAVALALFFHRALGYYPSRIRPITLFKFLLLFLWYSFQGGLDVSRRVLGKRLAVNPGFVVYKFSCGKKLARFLLAMVLNLTPGTLSVELREDELLLHLLDVNNYREKDIERLEGLLCRLFS